MSLPNLIARTGESPEPDSDSRSWASVWHRLLNAESVLWSLAVAAMLVDVTLTVHGLQLGLAEMNPIARRAIESASVLGLYALKLLTLGVSVCCRPLLPDRHTALIPFALLLPSFSAVLINTTLIAIVVV